MEGHTPRPQVRGRGVRRVSSSPKRNPGEMALLAEKELAAKMQEMSTGPQPLPGSGSTLSSGSTLTLSSGGRSSSVTRIQAAAIAKAKSRSPSPGGARGTARGGRSIPTYLPLITKPPSIGNKKGESGTAITPLANFYELEKLAGWGLEQFMVEFTPDVDERRLRKTIVYSQRDTLGAYMYNGDVDFYTTRRYEKDPIVFSHQDKLDPSKVYNVKITWTRQVALGEGPYEAFHSLLLQRVMKGLNLVEQNRTYFDTNDSVEIPKHNLRIFPGYKASIHSYDAGYLLNLDSKSRVIRAETVLKYIQTVQSNCRGGDPRKKVEEMLVGSIVMTSYNNASYKVGSIAWDRTPKSTFDTKAGPVTFIQYYKTRYNLEIKDQGQPLILAQPDRKLFRLNQTPTDTFLVPEFCNPTGLTEDMRANFALMKDLAEHLHQEPQVKVDKYQHFMKRVRESPMINEYMTSWGIKFSDNILKVTGRELPAEKVLFKNQKEMGFKFPGDFGELFRNNTMLTSKDMKNWVVIVTDRDADKVNPLADALGKVSKPIGMTIEKPTVRQMKGNRAQNFTDEIHSVMKSSKWDLVMVILPNNNVDTYGAVKRALSVDLGQPSQCVLARTCGNKGLLSIATKIVLQMNAKLGGEPWSMKIPAKRMMICGFDSYRGGKQSRGKAVGAFVSTINGNTYSEFFSQVTLQDSTDELASTIASKIMLGVQAYASANGGDMPGTILFYRDNVGDGAIDTIFRSELPDLVTNLKEAYALKELQPPKLAYIIVNKGTEVKLFKSQGGKIINPVPGTVVDDYITYAHRYDFFLVPHKVRQGTVSPTSFNVLHDTTGLSPDRMQRLTYKLCHMYYNFTGTVGVPAPVQYAHKLAMQTGIALGKGAHQDLCHQLHFL